MQQEDEIIIAGAGPAGLTAAYQLAKFGLTGTIVEADSQVGGIARTVERDGYRFDIGGHRFLTKLPQIERLWNEMLGEPMLRRPRLSRIYYGGKFYDYPLKPLNAVRNLGLITSTACMLSYAKSRLLPVPEPTTYEQWVVKQFGRKLFGIFFKSYTEKVWGIGCNEIGADWAAQRIKGLNLGEAVRHALFGQRRGKLVKTLTEEFLYPRLGPGQLWERVAQKVVEKGWTLKLNARVAGLKMSRGRVTSVATENTDGRSETLSCGKFFSSMPLRGLLSGMSPQCPPEVLQAAKELKYRDFLTVALVLDTPHVFPDNWIYVHSPEVRMGRIQNFKEWSPEMVPDASKTCLGLEYFVNAGDELWSSSDEDLVSLGYRELQAIGLGSGKLVKGYVVRMPKAYPVYDTGYRERLSVIREWLGNIDNLYCIGRNGQHRYNNQDHSMATALIAARNAALGECGDPWNVNEDAEYHEIVERDAPETPASAIAGVEMSVVGN